MRKIRVGLLLGLIVGCLGVAQAGPFDIKGVKPEMRLEDVKTLYPEAMCHDLVTNPIFDHACRIPGVTYAGKGTNINVHFLEGVSMVIVATIDSKEFDAVVGALKEKYGKPSTVDERNVQSGIGVMLTNTILVWKRGTSMLRAERYSSKVTESAVSLTDTMSMERAAERKKQFTKKRAEDL